jgi:dipeptidyl aminopeptidase/acylaminoacyl peptidase
VVVERRRAGSAAAALRRELRKADETLFALEQTRPAERASASGHTPPPADAFVRQDTHDADRFAQGPRFTAAESWPLTSHDAADLLLHPELEPLAPAGVRRDRAPRFRAGLWLIAATLAALLAFAAGYLSVPLLQRARSAFTAADAPPAGGSVPGLAHPATAVLPASIERRLASDEASEGKPAVDEALLHAVPAATGTNYSPSFAWNGAALFFHTGGTSDATSALAATDLRGGARVVTILDDGSRNFHVRPSPDGSRIAFDSDRDGERGVYVARRDGSAARRVSGAGPAALPAWSPDGRTLAFVRAERDRASVWNLWLLDVGAGSMRQVTSYRYGQTGTGSWFPDGRRIAYSHEDRLVVRDLATGESREFPSPLPHRLVRTPAVSPDGRRVMFQVSGSGGWMLDVSSGAMQAVLADPSAEEFAWAPDGGRVAFHSRRGGRWAIWVAAIAEPRG